MRLAGVQTAPSGDRAMLGDAAREGRAAAMSRRRALAAGRSALPARERVRTRTRLRAAERRGATAAVEVPKPTCRGASSGALEELAEPAITAKDVVAARLGRAMSMQRRRQVSQGKQALTGLGARAFVLLRGGAR